MNRIGLLTKCHKEHSLHIHYTFSGPRAASNEQRKCQNNTPSLAARFTSTSVQTAASGSAQAISRARIDAPAPKKRASPKPRKSPRTGTYSFVENSALERSKAKSPF